jgi:predicted DNA-binding transcriptional regulator YafY
MQINRLFEIVYLLMNKKATTAKELSDHFEVSQRTIYRDIETLCQAGIPIYTTKGKGGGIGLMDHFVLNKSVLSSQEQNEILAALHGLKATNYTETDQVLSKLNSLFGTENADWIEVDFSYWNSNEEDKMKFAQIKNAILNHKIILFDYFNSYGQESHRSIGPMKLIFRGQAWYLLGYCLEKKDNRYFKITRMKNLQVTQQEFITPSIEAKTEDLPSPNYYDTVPLLLRIDAEMAYRIYDEFPKDAIQRMDDGSFLVHTSMKSGGWLTGYLMSYEDHIEVLEPVELKDNLIQKYKNALSKYDI